MTMIDPTPKTAKVAMSPAKALRFMPLFLAIGLGVTAVQAQDFQRPNASENIADSEISVEDTRAADRADELLGTLNNLPASIDRLKIITTMEKIDVAYLSDLIGENAPESVQDAIAANDENINELQNAIEGSAIFYNALVSQEVNIPDVVSIKLDEPNATVFVRGVPPGAGVSIEQVEGENGGAGAETEDGEAGTQAAPEDQPAAN